MDRFATKTDKLVADRFQQCYHHKFKTLRHNMTKLHYVIAQHYVIARYEIADQSSFMILDFGSETQFSSCSSACFHV